MNTKNIWVRVNESKELIHAIYRAICGNKDINNQMSQLKKLIPCLIGVDFDKRALVFRSTDEGIVAVYIEEQDDTLALAMGTDIALD